MIQKVKDWKVTEENGAQFEVLGTYGISTRRSVRRLSDGKVFNLRDYVWNTKLGVEDFQFDRISLFWPDMIHAKIGNGSRTMTCTINELSKLETY